MFMPHKGFFETVLGRWLPDKQASAGSILQDESWRRLGGRGGSDFRQEMAEHDNPTSWAQAQPILIEVTSGNCGKREWCTLPNLTIISKL